MPCIRVFLTSLKQTCNEFIEYLIKFSENLSAPNVENRKTSPCSQCAPNLLHVLVSRIVGYHNLCSPVKWWSCSACNDALSNAASTFCYYCYCYVIFSSRKQLFSTKPLMLCFVITCLGDKSHYMRKRKLPQTWNCCFGCDYIFYLCHSVELSHGDCTSETPNPGLTIFQKASNKKSKAQVT